MVEKNSDFGLLVGVSSGGRFRVPTGDILWRVDERPHRELRAADNPVAQTASANSPANNNPLTNLTADTLRLASALTATSTMASGDKARQMLREMLAGQSLLFRSSAATQLTGVPDYNRLLTGQRTAQGIRPYPLDASFRSALEVCQISSFTAQ